MGITRAESIEFIKLAPTHREKTLLDEIEDLQALLAIGADYLQQICKASTEYQLRASLHFSRL